MTNNDEIYEIFSEAKRFSGYGNRFQGGRLKKASVQAQIIIPTYGITIDVKGHKLHFDFAANNLKKGGLKVGTRRAVLAYLNSPTEKNEKLLNKNHVTVITKEVC